MRAWLAMVVLLACTCEAHYGEPTCGDKWGDGTDIAVTTADCGVGLVAREDAADVTCAESPCDPGSSSATLGSCCESPTTATCGDVVGDGSFVAVTTSDCGDGFARRRDAGDVQCEAAPCDVQNSLVDHDLCCEVPRCMNAAALRKLFKTTGIVDYSTNYCVDELDAPTDPDDDDLDTDVMTDADIDPVDKAVDWDFPEQEAATKSVTCAPIHVTADGQGVASAHCDGGHAADEPLCVFECPMGFVVTGANPIFCDPNTGKWPAFPKCVSLWDDELEV